MSSQFREMYEDSLRQEKPDRYRELKASGQLAAHLDEAGTAAQKEFDAVFSALNKQEPGPTLFLDKAVYLKMLAAQAREMAVEAVLSRPNIPMARAYQNDDDREAMSR